MGARVSQIHENIQDFSFFHTDDPNKVIGDFGPIELSI
jgi:hypothetical protein